ncbi:MAG TPA: murein biosynthesis integral membrane protein MurJ [Elusimicrobia bacterium]|nr:murein biosynthesis integral membrane protein MurJ [Elusimicrobiota bacterium]HBW23766.1 murein biosynthesis integral membrane protein MurJ [Elusimicrobiota bacterium]
MPSGLKFSHIGIVYYFMREKSTPPPPHSSFLENLRALSSATLLTKVLGYARDAGLVAVFGGGALTDAYYAAFRILNVFRRTVGEGAVNAGFIPALEKEKAVSSAHGAVFFSAAWTLVFFVSLALASLGAIFRHDLVRLTSYGFTARPEQFLLTAAVTAILMPHLIFVNVSALFQSALNAAGKFFLPALAPAAFSLSIIAYLLFMAGSGGAGLADNVKIMGLAGAASLSGLIQVLILLPMLKKAGYGLALSNPFKNAAVSRSLLLAAPAAAAMAQDQIALFVNTMFASFLEPGSITAIYNAARVIQFPVSLFAAAAASVTLPELSRHSADNEPERFGAVLGGAFKTTALIIIPAALGLMALSLPICRTLFEHGRFTREQSGLTAGVLFYLSLGLAGFGVNKLAASACYGAGDVKTPVKIVLFQTALNAALCFPLMRAMGAEGLALATALSSLAAAALFIRAAKIRGAFYRVEPGFYLKTLAASALMCAFCLGATRLLSDVHPAYTVALAVPGGIAIYFGALKILRLEERKLLTGGRF